MHQQLNTKNTQAFNARAFCAAFSVAKNANQEGNRSINYGLMAYMPMASILFSQDTCMKSIFSAYGTAQA
jgi:hypothetical protein